MKPRKMNCSRCGLKLKETGFGGYENALRVKLDGGYAEFVDTIVYGKDAQTKSPLGHLICHKCAHELMNWLGIPADQIKSWHPHSADEPLCDGWLPTLRGSWD